MILEYQPTMWIFYTVGSPNVDERSFYLNEEINLFVHDSAFAGLMKERYQQDLARCRPYTAAMWRGRPLEQRMTEWLVAPFRSEL